MARPLVILGARSFAEEVADLAAQTTDWQVVAFVENMEHERCGATLCGLRVRWVDDLPVLARDHWAIGGFGTTHRAEYLRQAEEAGMRFATVVHPTAHVSPSATLDDGCLVSVGTIVAAQTHLRRHVVLNRGALVGHHTEIGPCSTIGPGANIAGKCRLGERVYVGMSAVVLNGITIGERSVIGAGAVVTKDLPPRVLAVGVPARIVKEGVEGE